MRVMSPQSPDPIGILRAAAREQAIRLVGLVYAGGRL